MENICIVGTGGFAREVLCLIDDLSRYNEVNAFLEPDDIWEKNWQHKKIMGIPVLPYSSFNPMQTKVAIGIGNSKIRQKIVEQELPKNTVYETLIHPTAVVSRWCNIGAGSIITAGCILTCQINLGQQAHLNLDTTIGHDCNIDDYFTTAPSVNISGICNIGKHVYFGTGAATRQGIEISDNVLIGMGAMVVKNIVESGTYVGIPAKKKA